jgi:hypothetical protein
MFAGVVQVVAVHVWGAAKSAPGQLPGFVPPSFPELMSF